LFFQLWILFSITNAESKTSPQQSFALIFVDLMVKSFFRLRESVYSKNKNVRLVLRKQREIKPHISLVAVGLSVPLLRCPTGWVGAMREGP